MYIIIYNNINDCRRLGNCLALPQRYVKQKLTFSLNLGCKEFNLFCVFITHSLPTYTSTTGSVRSLKCGRQVQRVRQGIHLPQPIGDFPDKPLQDLMCTSNVPCNSSEGSFCFILSISSDSTPLEALPGADIFLQP